MSPTDFWYKLVDMTQSNTAVFTIAGWSLTEKQLLWIIGIVVLILVIFLLRSAVMWVLNPTAAPKEGTAETPVAAATPAPKPATPTNDILASAAVQPKQGEKAQPIESPKKEPELKAPETPNASTQTPQELLADTSDRKRTLHDYVTPDTVHAEVMKQTLNNDFPYKTLQPDASKISTAAPTPTPMTPPTSADQKPLQPTAPVTTTLPPLPDKPISQPSAPATPPAVTTMPSTPTVTPDTLSKAPVVPTLNVPGPTPAAPVSQPAAPSISPMPQVAPAAPVATAPKDPTFDPIKAHGLPPLPENKESETPVSQPTAPGYNPADPIMP